MSNNKFLTKMARALSVMMGAFALVAPLSACNGDGETNGGGSTASNETTPLVLATDVLDSVFNPFFYTSGPDGEVVSQTQVGMLSSDKNGKLLASWDEPCVAFKYGIVTTGTREDKKPLGDEAPDDEVYENYYTDYYFALKNNLKFSDGTDLTYKDVLFNIYMYLDPAYTGSNTMYSVSIKGLQDYRAGIKGSSASTDESFYNSEVESRLNVLYTFIDDAVKEGSSFDFNWSDMPLYGEYMEKDIDMLKDLFEDEINSDWASAQAVELEKDFERYVDKGGNLLFTKHWEVFLYYHGLVNLTRIPGMAGTANEKDYYEMQYSLGEPEKDFATDETSLKQYVRNNYFGDYKKANLTNYTNFAKKLATLIDASATGIGSFRDYLRSDVMKIYLENNPGERVTSVSGIEVVQMSAIPDAKRDANGDAVSNENGDVKDSIDLGGTYDVLHITINGVDPKAIQNFGFTVAPGHYYSKTWDKINMNYGKDYANPYFGVDFNNFTAMREIQENQLPLGAGPYKAATINNVVATDKDDFFSGNTVYMIANEHFMLGEPKIKRLRFQVVNSNLLYNAVKSGSVSYASPSMSLTQMGELEADRALLSSASADNLGYGYIGVSARYVPNIWVRRAIMSTLNPQYCVDYYGNENASIIRRPMSKTLVDYYDVNAFNDFGDGETTFSYYPYAQKGGTAETLAANQADYVTAAEKAGEIAKYYAQTKGGCVETNSEGTLIDPVSGKALEYTFTVAGNTTDHPAYQMLLNSSRILNENGFKITIVSDSTALTKLAAGKLTVWAAAWSSSSDPDMYQVYHKDSSATSTRAWGYDFILGSQHQNNTNAPERKYEKAILDDLAELIEKGRETTVVGERKGTYVDAQNKLMELAVEFPAYQRKVYYVWQANLFDESTMFTDKDVTSYQSPLSRIWEVSYANQ